uniref:hypothetical protein n=1 Tax=Lachnoclostridium phocaeense TaxID=1871021 RepID=UPI0026DA8307|nr:hypothetical protein [Lachnoclostridium phocaeense]
MRYNKILCFLGISLCLATYPSTVQAEETMSELENKSDEAKKEGQEVTVRDDRSEENTSEKDVVSKEEPLNLLGADLDILFSNMRDKLESGETFTFSELLSESGGKELSEDPAFEISAMEGRSDDILDMGLLNMQYACLAADMEEQYIGADLSGMGQGCMSLFNEEYGNIVQDVQLKEPTIPEGFSVSSMLSAGQDAINQAYSSVMSGSAFSTAKTNISIGDIFEKANSGLSTPSLASSEDLRNLLSVYSDGNKSTINSEYSDRQTWLNEKRADVRHDLEAKNDRSFLEFADAAESYLLGDKYEKEEDKSAQEKSQEKAEEMMDNMDVGYGSSNSSWYSNFRNRGEE